jgi:hypothetical protein
MSGLAKDIDCFEPQAGRKAWLCLSQNDRILQPPLHGNAGDGLFERRDQLHANALMKCSEASPLPESLSMAIVQWLKQCGRVGQAPAFV